MTKKAKILIKVGDKVQITSGFYKDESGEVLKVNKKTGKIVIKGINLKFKHIKPTADNEVGEIKQLEAPVHHSNVKLKLKETS